jgi:hypothetical protein
MEKNSTPGSITRKSVLWIAAFCAAYLILSYFLVGFKMEQVYLVLLFNIMFFISTPTRKFILGFLIFIVFWVIFDYMKAFPNYRVNPVHTGSLYNTEKTLFGINANGTIVTPNEYWLLHKTDFLSILTGIFYLCWVPVPLVFAGWLFFKNKKQFFYFSFTFLLANLIGFAIYYIYPAAPPWYIQQYGFTVHFNTPGNTAGLAKFDELLHVTIFKGLYEHSSNVFAAMPSLHSAYPLIVFYYGLKNKVGFVNILFATVMVGIWFSSVYNSHHYVLDVLAGISCAVVAIITFPLLVKHIKWANNKMQQLIEVVS